MEARFLDLLEAVQSGKVSFKAWAQDSYRKTHVKLVNRTRQSLEIDFSRSGLVPDSDIRNPQRIGLSHPTGSKPGNYTRVLRPEQQIDIVFISRCLNGHGFPPTNGTIYKLIPKLLPDFIVDALRRGLDQDVVWEITDGNGGTWQSGSVLTQGASSQDEDGPYNGITPSDVFPSRTPPRPKDTSPGKQDSPSSGALDGDSQILRPIPTMVDKL